jgi:23S rRNA (cytosine1962-C5)-methyltransferase
MEQVLPELVGLLPEVCGVETIFERNDSSGRALEGLPPRKGRLWGEGLSEVEFSWAGVSWVVDLLEGQKTGFYLDQLESYLAVAKLARGARVLDSFSNQGGFALSCAQAGAASVLAVESSATAVVRLQENIRRNRFQQVEVNAGDVFVFLRRAEKAGRQFDGIVLDPPSFARGRGAVQEALRGYRELHLRAARLLAPGGWLASFSCSHQIAAADFLEAAREGAAGAGKRFLVEERLDQPLDHPVALHLPESEYLKGFILREVSGR